MTLPLPPSVVSTLEEGRQVYVAVDSRRGPHVTPDLYAWSGGALWFAVAASTLKARVLTLRPSAAALVSVPGRSVVLAGATRLIDPRSARDLARTLPGLPDAVRALSRYTARNAPDLLAFVGDTARGRLGLRLPSRRVLVRLEPARAAVVEGDAIAEGYGDWAGIRPGPRSDRPIGGGRAVVALPGPVAVPCRWSEADRLARLPAGVRAVSHLDGPFPLGIVVDEYNAPGPSAKEGTLLRGRGRLRSDRRTVDVELERVVTWEGVETSSAPAAS